MSILDNQITNLLKARMNFLTQSQKLVNKNIANSDTPNYKAEYIPEKHFKAFVNSTQNILPIASTNSHHFAASGIKNDNRTFRVKKDKDVDEETYDGNNVDIIEQTTNLKKIDLESQEITGVYKKMIAMLRSSLGR